MKQLMLQFNSWCFLSSPVQYRVSFGRNEFLHLSVWKPPFSRLLKFWCCINPGKREIFSASIKGFVVCSFFNLRIFRPLELFYFIKVSSKWLVSVIVQKSLIVSSWQSSSPLISPICKLDGPPWHCLLFCEVLLLLKSMLLMTSAEPGFISQGQLFFFFPKTHWYQSLRLPWEKVSLELWRGWTLSLTSERSQLLGT